MLPNYGKTCFFFLAQQNMPTINSIMLNYDHWDWWPWMGVWPFRLKPFRLKPFPLKPFRLKLTCLPREFVRTCRHWIQSAGVRLGFIHWPVLATFRFIECFSTKQSCNALRRECCGHFKATKATCRRLLKSIHSDLLSLTSPQVPHEHCFSVSAAFDQHCIYRYFLGWDNR
jgi:hypothetical protein